MYVKTLLLDQKIGFPTFQIYFCQLMSEMLVLHLQCSVQRGVALGFTSNQNNPKRIHCIKSPYLLLPSSAQFQLSEVEAEMVFIVAISTQPPTHPADHPGKYQNGLGQLIIGKESC